ncbi:MAG: hypothetical protein EAZ12_05415 [Sphingobacteriia bacterium]|nr:MAG: hypothetical protein EAZ12_05415 [Sphingobacteriia bacterium]
MKIVIRLFIAFVILFAVYNVWILMDVPNRNSVFVKTTVAKESIITIGTDAGNGNILGIQPQLTASNYANIPTFKETIRAYLLEAKSKQLINPKTVVLLPEQIGSLLIAYEEKEKVYTAATMEEAMQSIVRTNLFKFIVEFFSSDTPNKSMKAAIAMKSKQAGKIYWEVFGDLAKEFNVTIAAGSILLPNATRTAEGTLIVNKGNLFNTAAIFNRDGKVDTLLQKTEFPIDQLSGLMSQFETSIHVFQKSNQSMGWKLFDIKSPTANSAIHYGMNLSIAGQFWDKKGDGRALVINNDSITVIPAATTGRMINLWTN